MVVYFLTPDPSLPGWGHARTICLNVAASSVQGRAELAHLQEWSTDRTALPQSVGRYEFAELGTPAFFRPPRPFRAYFQTFYYIVEPWDLFHRIRAEISFKFHLRMLKTVEYEPENGHQTSRSQLYMFDEQNLTNACILRPWDPSHWIRNALLINFGVGNTKKHSVST